MAADLDLDGEDEYVIRNNKLFAVFESHGGRCVLAAAYDALRQDGEVIVGAPLTNPSAPGEEEFTGPAANRCSAFKEMNGGTYADASYTAAAITGGWRFTSPDGKIVKDVLAASGSDVLQAGYEESVDGVLFVRIGLSPNPHDLMLHGHAHLVGQLRTAENAYILLNTAGGGARLDLGGATFIGSPADAGWNRRNLALTEEVEVAHDGEFTLALRLIAGAPAVSEAPPGGGHATPLAASGPFPSPSPGTVRLTVWLGQAAPVRCEVLDAGGRRVANTDLGIHPAGPLDLGLEPRASDGTPLAAGVYFVRITAGAARAERRWVLLRP
jgi:hypothetical protein